MAFMGMVFGVLFLIILVIIFGLMLLSFGIAIPCKIIGKSKRKKGLRITGNVFLVLGIVFTLPFIGLAAFWIWSVTFTKVTAPSGKEYTVLTRDVGCVISYLDDGSDEAMDKLESLISRKPNLVYWRDNNYKGILERGLETGNLRMVEISLDHGGMFDDPLRFEHMAYIDNSMEEYLGYLSERSVTSDDVEILRLMFSYDVELPSYDTDMGYMYSNVFGAAFWAVTYNDEYVTDTELELMDVLIDNGKDHDPGLLLFEDHPYNIVFAADFASDLVRDDNYYEIVHIANLDR